MHIQEQTVCNTSCLLIGMIQQGIVQILQNRHLLRNRIFQKFRIHRLNALINNPLLIGCQFPVFTGNHIHHGLSLGLPASANHNLGSLRCKQSGNSNADSAGGTRNHGYFVF